MRGNLTSLIGFVCGLREGFYFLPLASIQWEAVGKVLCHNALHWSHSVYFWNKIQHRNEVRRLGACWSMLTTASRMGESPQELPWVLFGGLLMGLYKNYLHGSPSLCILFPFYIFSWHRLWWEHRSALYHHLCLFFGLTWLFSFVAGWYYPLEGSFYEGDASYEVLPEQMGPKWQLWSMDFSVSSNSVQSWQSSDIVTSVSLARIGWVVFIPLMPA